MKRHAGIAIVAAALGFAVPLEAFAEEGTVRGKFVRLTEKKVGEREYVGVVIAQGEGKEEAVVFMGRDSKLLPAARKLRKGQQVEVTYVAEAGQKWAKRIGAEAGDRAESRDRPKVRDGGVRGKFVRLDEKTVGEKEYIAVVVQTAGADAATVLLTGRGTDAAARARKLRKGQQVEISYVTEGGQKWIRRIGAKAKHGQVRGRFVRLARKKVGEKEYIAVVVQPADADAETVLLAKRGTDAAAMARKLRKGQRVEISYVTERDQKWVKRIEAAGGEDASLREQVRLLSAALEQMNTQLQALAKELDALRTKNLKLGDEVRRLSVRRQQMMGELDALRKENAKLKKLLREK